MVQKQILVIACICTIIACIIPVHAIQISDSPPTLKTYVPSSHADDDRFFKQVSDLLMPYSGESIPRGMDLTSIQMFPLVSSSYNVEDFEVAQTFLNMLYYTGRAGEMYQQYLDVKQGGVAPIDPNDLYDLSQQHYNTAKGIYQRCQECKTYLPEFVMYSFPGKGDPAVETETEAPTPTSIMRPSDPSRPYDDEAFGTIADLWFYLYLLPELEAGYVQGHPSGEDPSVRIIRGSGPSNAQQIYFAALDMNFSPEIHAYVSELVTFFHAISQAGAEFAAFEGEKVLPTTLTKGTPEYERAKKWYQTAQAALKRSELTEQGVTLPAFVSFEEAFSLPRGYDISLQSALTPNIISGEVGGLGRLFG